MARKKRSEADPFQAALDQLNQSIPENLRLPSLAENRLSGLAYAVVMILPLLDSRGKAVFPDSVVEKIYVLLNARFGGCLVSSSSSSPPFWGLWNPNPQATDAVKDYVTTVQVFANPIEATNRFFIRLKEILKEAGEQEELLIARMDCRLL